MACEANLLQNWRHANSAICSSFICCILSFCNSLSVVNYLRCHFLIGALFLYQYVWFKNKCWKKKSFGAPFKILFNCWFYPIISRIFFRHSCSIRMNTGAIWNDFFIVCFVFCMFCVCLCIFVCLVCVFLEVYICMFMFVCVIFTS